MQATETLKQAGGADVILVTGNSYKAASESLKGLRPDGRMVLMGISEEPLIVTSHYWFFSKQPGISQHIVSNCLFFGQSIPDSTFAIAAAD